MFGNRPGAIEHDRRGAKLVAAVHDDDPRGELGEEHRLLHGRVSAADDDRRHILEERGVAGRAVADPTPRELLLAGHAQLAVLGAHGQHDRPRQVQLVADPHLVRASVCGELDRGRLVGLQAGAEALGLVPEARHHVGTHDPLGEAGVVLHVGGLLEQAAPGETLDDQRLEVGSRGVERGRVARRTAADDDHVLDSLIAHFIKYS